MTQTDTRTHFEVVFDGGSLGNPGKGYGSFHISVEGAEHTHQKREYGDSVSNNQAEYQTLVEALRWLADDLGASAAEATVTVRGDSQLVINQLLGKWKVKHAGLKPLYAAAIHELARFHNVDLIWHDRKHSVKVLGH